MRNLRAVTIGIAGAMAVATMSSSYAAPVIASAGLINATPSQTTNVQFRGVKPGGGGVARGGFAGRGFAGGGFAGRGFAGQGFAGRGFNHGGFRGGRVAAGVIVGAAAANAYGPNYYQPYYGDPDAGYDPGYADAPVVYGSPYGDDGGPCVTDDGYGRQVPCR